MRARHIFPLLWVMVFAITLPILAWYGAEATALQEQKERQVANLERQKVQQAQVLRQVEQDAQFVSLVQVFVNEAQRFGLTDRGVTQYPVRFRETVEPADIQAEFARLRGEPGRFFLPQTFYLGREGLDLASRQSRRLETLPRVRQDSYVMSYQGRALVINDEI
jgi:hypothetical protein